MEKNSRILYPYANVMGIFFPEGKLDEGGTCQYFTYHIKDTEKEQAHLNLDCKKCYEEKIGCFLEN